MNSISARAAIVGVARSETPFTPGRSSLQLHAEYAREVIADAGLVPADIDGVLTAGCDEPTYCKDAAHSAVLCEYMGLRPRFTYSVDLGTPVFAKVVEVAATAIASGLCRTVPIACAEPTVSRASRRGAVEKMASFGHPDFELRGVVGNRAPGGHRRVGVHRRRLTTSSWKLRTESSHTGESTPPPAAAADTRPC